MDNSRSTLPNVDRANSTLFKRYLEEQHKSILKSNPHSSYSRPINPNFQIQHQELQSVQTKTYQPGTAVKRKVLNGKKTLNEPKSSHTSRFMRRFQRYYKQRDVINQTQKREIRPQFEIPFAQTKNESKKNEKETNCICSTTTNQKFENRVHSPMKAKKNGVQTFNENLKNISENKKKIFSLPTNTEKIVNSTPLVRPCVTPTIDSLTGPESILTLNNNFIDEQKSTKNFYLDDENQLLINELLEDLSIALTDKPSVDTALEIESSLAQRIYNSIIEGEEQNQEENNSFTTTTLDSSTANEKNNNNHSNSPIKKTMNNKEKYFQPIREEPTPMVEQFSIQHHQMINFNPLKTNFANGGNSPFIQSLFEPVNLLRNLANSKTSDECEPWNFLSHSFSFDLNEKENFSFNMKNVDQTKTEIFRQPFSSVNHLALPRTTPIKIIESAFKPPEPTNSKSSSSFAFPSTFLIGQSKETQWFGQTKD